MPDWREFFGGQSLPSLEEARLNHPNLDKMAGCVFISHSGRDRNVIENELIDSIIFERKGPNGYFLYSSLMGGDIYKAVVLAALSLCRYAIVVAGRNSLGHPWIEAEVDWLLAHGRPIAVYKLDRTPPVRLHPGLGFRFFRKSQVNVFERSNRQALTKWIDRVDRPCP